MQQVKRSTHLPIFFHLTSLYFFSSFWVIQVSDANHHQGQHHLNTLQFNTRDVTSYDVRGGIGGYPPIHDVIKKNWDRGSPSPYNRTRSLVSISKYGMDSNKCLWCDWKFFAYRHYTRCCGRLYHHGCLLHYTSTLPPWERFCPHCRAVNLGEPFRPTPIYKVQTK